jgi:pimeloyl-ACP methyl ester carboxylesterase
VSRLAKLLVGLGLGVLLLVIVGAAALWLRPLAVFSALGRRALRSAGFVRVDVETPAGRQVLFKGGSGPTVVLLHGAGDQAGGFSKVAPDLAKGRTVLVPDLAGHGKSAPSRGPIRLTAIVEALEVAIEKEAPSGPVVLVGHSMGAWAASLLAKRNPERVSQLVLVNGGPLRGEERGFSLKPKDREEARKLMEVLRDPLSPKIPDFVLDDVVRETNAGPISRLDMKDMEASLLDGKLRDVAVPTDILWGVSDRLLPLDYAKKLAAELPAARVTELPACGHVPLQECPDELLLALKKALDSPLPRPTTSAPPALP